MKEGTTCFDTVEDILLIGRVAKLQAEMMENGIRET